MKRFKISGVLVSTTTILVVWLLFISFAMSNASENYYPQNAPLANAGLDKTIYLPQDAVALQSNATDKDGEVMFYYWAQVGGPSTAGMKEPFTDRLQLSDLKEGHYTFRLVVIDNEGHPAQDDVEVFVKSR
ncbi:MAG: hypothetical protein AAFP70_13830 [Calditrichota bacterium]